MADRGCRIRPVISGHTGDKCLVLAIFRRFPPKLRLRLLQFLGVRAIRSHFEGFTAMTRPGAALGFNRPEAGVASPRLLHAVAASLALSALSLCLIVTLTLLSPKGSVAAAFWA